MSEATLSSPKSKRRISWNKWLYMKSAAAFRWLHIYISMLCFATMMFFAFTGLTLNHPTWFGASEFVIEDYAGSLEEKMLTGDPDKLAIAEFFRAEHKLNGAVTEFEISEYDLMVVFKGPGYATDIFVDRETGKYTVSESKAGMMAVMNDLHKGRDSGAKWSWVIDISAVVTMLAGLSGFGLLFYVKKRRIKGLWTTLAGTIILVVVWALYVP